MDKKERTRDRKHSRSNEKEENKSKKHKEVSLTDGKHKKLNDYERDRKHSNRHRRYGSESREYGNYKRYWGENHDEQREKNKKVKDNYLVGSRYYNDSQNSNIKTTSDGSLKSKENVNPHKVDIKAPKRKNDDIITSRTGGAYIPPGKLRLMQASITDKSRYILLLF